MSTPENLMNDTDKYDPIREEFFSERVRDEAIIQLKTVSGKTAADVGAYTGFMSEGLLDAELRVLAVESSPDMVEFMKEKFADIPEFKVIQTDPGSIKLEDESVDYVFANMHLHHMEDPQAAIKEIYRILRNGGKAALTDLILNDSGEPGKKYHLRWPGFSFPDLYDWFIKAEFKNISIEKLNQSVTCIDENGSEIKIDIFIACGEK